MSALEGLSPHKTTLIVLDAHDTLTTLWVIAVLNEHFIVHQVRDVDVDGGAGGRVESKLSIPCHVLDREKGAVGKDDHVIITVTDQNSVGAFDDLGQDMLDGVGRVVALLLGTAVAPDKDALHRALGPGDVRSVHGTLNISAVKVDAGARREIVDFGGESKNVPENGAHLVDFVGVEARVGIQDGVINDVINITGGIAPVHSLWRLDTGCWED